MLHLKMSLVAIATAGMLAVTGVPAHAGSTFSGFVDANTGAVSGSSGFTGYVTGPGAYTVLAPQSKFSSFPVMTVTPFGVNGAYTTGILTSEYCASGVCRFTVQIVTVSGATPYNNSWAFSIVDF